MVHLPKVPSRASATPSIFVIWNPFWICLSIFLDFLLAMLLPDSWWWKVWWWWWSMMKLEHNDVDFWSALYFFPEIVKGGVTVARTDLVLYPGTLYLHHICSPIWIQGYSYLFSYLYSNFVTIICFSSGYMRYISLIAVKGHVFNMLNDKSWYSWYNDLWYLYFINILWSMIYWDFDDHLVLCPELSYCCSWEYPSARIWKSWCLASPIHCHCCCFPSFWGHKSVHIWMGWYSAGLQ